jgi:hypothetical protein
MWYSYVCLRFAADRMTSHVSFIKGTVDNHVKPRQSTVNLPVFTDKR